MRREARATHRRKCARDAAGRAAGGAGGPRKSSCYQDGMIEKISDEALIDATRALLKRACDVEADLLLHLGEIDERKLYLPRAHPSMFAFCFEELGFSEDAADNPIFVARAARGPFTASRALRDKLKHAQDLRRHQVGDGDLAEIVERGLDLLIARVEKERFAVGRKPKKAVEDCTGTSRHVPDPIRRLVHQRD